VIFIANLNRLI